MAFVRSKRVGGQKYYQLVRNYREGGKHRQEVLYHLGKHRSLDEAIEAEKKKLISLRGQFLYWADEAQEWEQELGNWECLDTYLAEFDGEKPSLAEAYAKQNNLRKRRRDHSELTRSQLSDLDMTVICLDYIVKFYGADHRSEMYRNQVIDQEQKLDKLLDLRRKYFSERLPDTELRQSSVSWGEAD